MMHAQTIRRRRAFDIAMLAIGLLALAGTVLLFVDRTDVRAGDVATSAETEAAPAGPSTALVIGDSFASGTGLGELSYPCRAATAMGWRCHLSAQPGTGYVSGGAANRFVVNEYTGETTTSFGERVTDLADVYAPDVVVLDGGRNDSFASRPDVYRAMVYTIGRVRETWPAARLVVVRPRELNDPANNAGVDDEFLARLVSEPISSGVVFVDPLHDPRFLNRDNSNLLIEDGRHPNTKGDISIGQVLAEELEAARVGGAQ